MTTNSWCITTADQFDDWFNSLDDKNQEDVLAILYLLEELGPLLSRPHADTLNGSQFPNMKELRVQSKGDPLRIFYAFDPERKAVLLCAGNKKGYKEKKFYNDMITLADQVFSEHLKNIHKK
jgi:hypothetical protein